MYKITYLPTLPDYKYSFTCKKCGSHVGCKIPITSRGDSSLMGSRYPNYLLVCEICLTAHDFVEDSHGYVELE